MVKKCTSISESDDIMDCYTVYCFTFESLSKGLKNVLMALSKNFKERHIMHLITIWDLIVKLMFYERNLYIKCILKSYVDC